MRHQERSYISTSICIPIRTVFLGLCLSLLHPGLALADEVPHLYEATIPVVSQDKDSRTDAIRTAFTQVLVRVSGRSDIGDAAKYPAIAQATLTATRYAQQFRYTKITTADTSADSGLAVWVRFDETAVGKLLRANNLPVWGATRPSTLIWLAIDNRGTRELLGADSHNSISAIVEERAKLRGLPLRIPLLDLTDRTSLNTSDVWGNFQSTILQASQRYQTEAVLVGRVYQSASNNWTGSWSLYVESGREDWGVNGASLADVLNAGIDRTAESLALRYGQVDQADTSTVLVEVKSITGLADYNRVVKYLQSISHVKDVQPVELRAQSAIFQLTIPGGRLAVARAVALGRVLATAPVESIPVTAPPPQNTQTPAQAGQMPPASVPAVQATRLIADLTYRLVP